MENENLYHEIGTASHSLGTANYYVRWIRTPLGTLQIAFDIMVVGEKEADILEIENFLK